MATALQWLFSSVRTSKLPPAPAIETLASARPDQNVPPTFELPLCNGIDVFEITIEELQNLLSTGKLTSVEYVAFCIERIRQIDQYLKSVIEINPDALSIAQDLDQERSHGNLRGKLHGIPVLVKDNIATKDRLQTTAGSWALLGSTVPRDAFIVTKLREAGAIILGHSNMDEWAAIRSTSHSTGYSPRGDQTRNPYNLLKSPRGSSSGSAVAVAANIVPLAIGTETDTSVVGPAMVAGIVGIKPTVGLTSRSGVVPISRNMDSVGPFGRTVEDVAVGLSVIVGRDERDAGSCVSARPKDVDYTACLTGKEVLKGAVFGLPQRRSWELVPEPQRSVAARAMAAIQACGAKILPTDFPCWKERIREDGLWDWQHGEPSRSEITVVKVDAFNDINKYLKELEGTMIRNVGDVIQYNWANAGSEGGKPGIHPAFASGQDLFEQVLMTEGKENVTYHSALAWTRKQCRENGIDGALRNKELRGGMFDALLLCDVNSSGQQIAAQAGYPVITVPIGVGDDGVPVSLTLQHTAWREADLIKWASAIEDAVRDAIGWRPLPKFVHSWAKNIPVQEEY